MLQEMPNDEKTDSSFSFQFSEDVYRHFGLDLLKMKDEGGPEHDWGICKKENAEKVTRNMLGFGMEQSQQIIIDYDKDYDYVLVRRIPKECGVL